MSALPQIDPELTRLFSALANTSRLDLVRAMLARESAGEANEGMSISELAEAAEMSRFSASRHLAILRHAGFVRAYTAGRASLHRLCLDPFETLDDWLYPHLNVSRTLADSAEGVVT